MDGRVGERQCGRGERGGDRVGAIGGDRRQVRSPKRDERREHGIAPTATATHTPPPPPSVREGELWAVVDAAAPEDERETGFKGEEHNGGPA